MCGRYVLVSSVEELTRFFDAREAPGLDEGYRPSCNVAPTRTVLGVTVHDGRRVLDGYRWGLVPSWAKDPVIGKRLFNARAETVATKPSFRAAFAHRRVAIPCDAYLEWAKGAGRSRQPYLFERADGAPIAFAGLWERWRDPRRDGGPDASVRSCTIITTRANEDVGDVHDRMPVVLEPDALDVWLDPAVTGDELRQLLRSTRPGTLVHHPVDRRIGDVRNDAPELIEPVELP